MYMYGTTSTTACLSSAADLSSVVSQPNHSWISTFHTLTINSTLVDILGICLRSPPRIIPRWNHWYRSHQNPSFQCCWSEFSGITTWPFSDLNITHVNYQFNSSWHFRHLPVVSSFNKTCLSSAADLSSVVSRPDHSLMLSTQRIDPGDDDIPLVSHLQRLLPSCLDEPHGPLCAIII